MKLKFDPKESERGILFINRSESRCGSCNGGADPHELEHKTLLGWRATDDWMEGCGEKFIAVSSDYWGIETDVKAMRPDLPYVGPEYLEPHRPMV